MTLFLSRNNIRAQKYLGLFKSLYFNIKYFGIKQGLKLPVLLTNSVILRCCKGSVKINSPLKRGMIMMGFNSTPLSTLKEHSVWNVEGEVIFERVANLGLGTKINVGLKGKLLMGNNFEITANSSISCHNIIEIGKECLFSWDVQLMDTDGHPIFDADDDLLNLDGEIILEDNIWVGCRCLILKNTFIAKGSVIAACSMLNKKYDIPNSLIAGVPATIKKSNITWRSV